MNKIITKFTQFYLMEVRLTRYQMNIGILMSGKLLLIQSRKTSAKDIAANENYTRD